MSQQVIAVVGLGYVGLPLAVEFGKKLRTIAYDLPAEKVAAYRKFVDPTDHASSPDLPAAAELALTPEPSHLPPAPSPTIQLTDEMMRQGAKVIVVEPYFDLKPPQAITNQIGGKVIVLAPSVGGAKEAADYLQLFDYDIAQLAAALKQATGK